MADTTRNSSWFWGPLSRLGITVAAATFLADQIHKWWMLLGYGIREKGRVAVTPFLDLVFALNKGVSYSFLSGSSQVWQIALAAFAATAALALAVWLARGVHDRLTALSIGLIMGGALGNGLDRLLLGGVADFFSFHAFGFYWYVFNIADVAIVAGVIGLLYESLTSGRNDSPARPLTASATKPPQSER